MHLPRAPRRRLSHALVASALLGVAAQAGAQAGPAAPDLKALQLALQLRSLAATCAQCHGTDGRPAADSLVPPLAGMPEARFRERMAAFKSAPAGDPGATVMPQLAKGFSDAQIGQLAAWFAAQPR
jgi:cytochrome c553